METRARYQSRQALHELQRLHNEMGGAVFVKTLQLQHDVAGAITLEPFVGDGRPGNVAAELLQFFTLIGAPATAAWRLKPCASTRSSGADAPDCGSAGFASSLGLFFLARRKRPTRTANKQCVLASLGGGGTDAHGTSSTELCSSTNNHAACPSPSHTPQHS